MDEKDVLRVALDWEVDGIDPPRSFGGWNTGRVVQQTHESLMEDDFDTPPTNPGQPTAIVQINTKSTIATSPTASTVRDQQLQFEMDRTSVANVLLELEKIDAIMSGAQ